MAIEKNNPTEEEVAEQPEGLPPEVMVEGEEEIEERPQDDFNANLADSMSDQLITTS